jgi:acetyltransferase-like isoleucine patch superfamily enzyme
VGFQTAKMNPIEFVKRVCDRVFALTRSHPSIFMAQNPEYKFHAIGEWTYGRPRVLSWGEGAHLEIGKFCSIAEGVTIMLGGEHRSEWVTTYPFNKLWEEHSNITGHPYTKGSVTIGHDVWIGYSATILSGVTIGTGAIIGANAVVAKDVQPYAIVAGNPARLIRTRFDEPTIDKLLRLHWWDLPDEMLRRVLPLLMSADIEGLLVTVQQEPT